MKIRNLITAAIGLTAFALTVAGQDCPKVMTSSPAEPVRTGMPITFTSTVSGGDPNVTPTYNWTVSAGTISSGQGTSVITVDTSGVAGRVTATVDIGGFDKTCGTNASSTSDVEKPKEVRKFADLVKPSVDEQNAGLEAFIVELQNDPTTTGYIFAYSTQAAPTTAKTFLKSTQAKVAAFGFDLSRLMLKEGGVKPAFNIEMFIVPDGTPPPKPDPAAAAIPKPAPKAKKS